MQQRIKEGMDVYGKNGEKVGDVGKVVVGETSKEARFFTIEKGMIFTKDYLVPREAIDLVDDRGAHISLTKDQVERLPEYQGRPPTEQDAHKAYEALGGQKGERGYTFGTTGGELGQRGGTTGTTGGELGQRGGTTGTQTGGRGGEDYVVTVERYLILTPEERTKGGYRDEWEQGKTGGKKG